MESYNQPERQPVSQNRVVYYAIQLLALSFLLGWCFMILEPFIAPVVWASVLAIALYPAHAFLKRKLGNRNGLSATIIAALMITLIIGPAVWLMVATVDEFRELGQAYQSGNLHFPPPSESVKSWPLVGNKLHAYWSEAATNMSGFIAENQAEVKSVVLYIFDLLKSSGKGMVIFLFSIIISGILLAYSQPLGEFMHNLLVRIAGPQGETMTHSAAVTVRNVAKGVLGVAVIQSLLAGTGMVIAGIPLAGLWILICLVLAIVQVGILPVSLGVIIYSWSNFSTTASVLLTGWMILVGLLDNFLKPILLGKGAPAPMAIVFVGAIGGFMVSGFIGLFTGAIILSLGYQLMIDWVNPADKKAEQ